MGYFKELDIERQEAIRSSLTASLVGTSFENVFDAPQEDYEFGDFKGPRFDENGEAI